MAKDRPAKGRFDVTLDEDERAATLLALDFARKHVEDTHGRRAIEGALRALHGARFYRIENVPRRMTAEEIAGNVDESVPVAEQARLDRQKATLDHFNEVARRLRQKEHDENAGGCQAPLSEDGAGCINWQCSWKWKGQQ